MQRKTVAAPAETQNLSPHLLDKFGPLMRLEDFASLLGTTGRRVSNAFANDLPWCREFRKRARIKIGRRIFLNTLTVAQIFQEAQTASGQEP